MDNLPEDIIPEDREARIAWEKAQHPGRLPYRKWYCLFCPQCEAKTNVTRTEAEEYAPELTTELLRANQYAGAMARDAEHAQKLLREANAQIAQLEAQRAEWMKAAEHQVALFYACKAAIEVIADLDAEETADLFSTLLNAIRLVEPTFEITESDGGQS